MALAALASDDLVIPQGATWSVAWVYLRAADDDPNATPTPVPLLAQGWIARMQVRRKPDAAEVLAQWHSDPDDPDADGLIYLSDDGVVMLTLQPEASIPWTWWRYGQDDVEAAPLYDVELERPAGPWGGREVVPFLSGRVQLSPELTES